MAAALPAAWGAAALAWESEHAALATAEVTRYNLPGFTQARYGSCINLVHHRAVFWHITAFICNLSVRGKGPAKRCRLDELTSAQPAALGAGAILQWLLRADAFHCTD